MNKLKPKKISANYMNPKSTNRINEYTVNLHCYDFYYNYLLQQNSQMKNLCKAFLLAFM